MKRKLSKIKKKLFPAVCSAISFFSASNQSSHASIISELNSLLELVIRFNALVSTGSRQTNRWKENFKSRRCQWNPGLCPELFYELPEDSDDSEIHNFDWAMNFVQGRHMQKRALREIGKEYTIRSQNSDSVNNFAVLFNGPSGTGKSYMCDLFSRLFIADGFDEYGPKIDIPTSILRVSSMDVDRNQKTSAWRQLLSDYSGDKGLGVNSSFRKYLEENPNGGIIVLEEIDKWWSSDVQEGLRSVIDDGRVSINGEYINVRNYLILMTSNMCAESLRGDLDPKATKEELELGLTAPVMSRSFVNRLCKLDFGIMSEDELVDIFIRDLDMWNARNADKNILIELSDDARDYIGQLLFKSKQGARAPKALFKTILPKIYYATKYAENHPDEFSSVVKYELVVNKDKTDLILEKKSDVTKADEMESSKNKVESDKKINDSKIAHVDNLIENLKNKGVNIDDLLEKLQKANLDRDELIEDINSGKLNLDNLNIDISNVDLLIEKLKEIYDFKNHQYDLNQKNNIIPNDDNRREIVVES